MRPQFTFSILWAALCLSGCANEQETVVDLCPNDDNKTVPGVCGCGVADVDKNDNKVMDCLEDKVRTCPEDSPKAFPGQCGCDTEDTDSDGDTLADCLDKCPDDKDKIAEGVCGCGSKDSDDNGDTIPDCLGATGDMCPDDDNKTSPGVCGCGVPDDDTDGDGRMDCFDGCPDDPEKQEPGICNCGKPDVDSDGDGYPDCADECPENAQKVKPGVCGCSKEDSSADRDGDGYPDCVDLCPDNKTKHEPGVDGCDANDFDGDGVVDASDACPYNPEVTDDPEKCNVGKDAQGNDAFVIWSAADFEALRKKISELETRVGMPCATLNAADCEGETAARVCTPDGSISKNLYAAQACTACTGNAGSASCPAPSAVPDACTQTDNPQHLYDCCEAATSPFCDGSNRVSCDTGKKMVILLEACSKSCNAGACVACIGDPVETGGANYACCDPVSYVQTCAASNMLVCDNGYVQTRKTLDGCLRPGSAEKPYAVGLPADPLEKPLLRVRLMRDIDFSESLDVKSTKLECQAAWKPVSLSHVQFDGNKKSISFTNNGRQCALNAPLFDVVNASRVTDLNLNYHVSGSAASAVANLVNRSVMQDVVYNGAVSIQNPIYGEDATAVGGVAKYNTDKAFGVIAALASHSIFRNVQVKSSLKVSDSYDATFGFAGFAGIAGDISLIDSSVSFDDMSCQKAPCAGVMGSASQVRVAGLTVDIDAMSSKQSHVYGLANALTNSDITDLSLRIGEMRGHADLAGACGSLTNTSLRNSKLKVASIEADVANSGVAYGLSKTIQSLNMFRSFVRVERLIAKDVYGFAGSAKVVLLDHSGLRLDHARGETNAVLFSDLSVKRIAHSAFSANLYQLNTYITAATVDFAKTLAAEQNAEMDSLMYAVRKYKFASLDENKEPLTPVYTKSVSISASNPVPMKNSWYLTAEEVTKAGVPEEGFTGFVAEEGSKALEGLGGDWQLKEFAVGEEKIKLPWLKAGDI